MLVNQVLQDPVLTELSIQYKNGDFIADQLFPRVNVSTETGVYYEFDRELERIEDSRRTRGTRANRVETTKIKRPYGPLTERSLEEAIHYDEIGQLGTLDDLEQEATITTTTKLLAGLEKEVADFVTNTANHVAGHYVTLSGTSQFSDYSGTSKPTLAFDAAKKAIKKDSGVLPTHAAMSYDTFIALSRHPELVALFMYGGNGVLTVDMMKQALGVPNLLIADFYANTAKSGQLDDLNSVWGKDIAFGVVSPTPSRRSMSSGYILTLDNSRLVDKWDEPQTKQYFVRANDFFEAKAVAMKTMYVIKAAIS